MSLYQRTRGGAYHVEVEWRGYPRLRLSTGTLLKSRAKAMERTLYALKSAGRRDILGLLVEGRLKLPEVHDDYARDPGALEHRIAQLDSPKLGPLVARWAGVVAKSGGSEPENPAPVRPSHCRAVLPELAAFLRRVPTGPGQPTPGPYEGISRRIPILTEGHGDCAGYRQPRSVCPGGILELVRSGGRISCGPGADGEGTGAERP